MGGQWCGFDESHTDVCIKGHVSRESLQADCIRVFLIVSKKRENTYRSVIVEYFVISRFKNWHYFSYLHVIWNSSSYERLIKNVCKRHCYLMHIITFIDMLSNP